MYIVYGACPGVVFIQGTESSITAAVLFIYVCKGEDGGEEEEEEEEEEEV